MNRTNAVEVIIQAVSAPFNSCPNATTGANNNATAPLLPIIVLILIGTDSPRSGLLLIIFKTFMHHYASLKTLAHFKRA
jgi:hypothetical protein